MCEQILVDVREAARRLGLGRSMVYRFIESGSLPSLKIGGSRRIVVADLERFVQRLREESGSGVGA